MDKGVYRKARELVDQGRVSLEDETDKRLYLLVRGASDTHKVRLEADHTFACTCPYATMRGIARGAVCSHVVAALLWVSEQGD